MAIKLITLNTPLPLYDLIGKIYSISSMNNVSESKIDNIFRFQSKYWSKLFFKKKVFSVSNYSVLTYKIESDELVKIFYIKLQFRRTKVPDFYSTTIVVADIIS